MKNESPLLAEKIRLLRVDIASAAIENPLDLITEKVTEFKYDLGYTAGYNAEARLAKTELEVSLYTELDKTKKQATGRFKLAYLYQIENFEELVKKESEDKLKVAADLEVTLASISYSTARGILLTRFQGTIFKNFILPVISPINLLKQK